MEKQSAEIVFFAVITTVIVLVMLVLVLNLLLVSRNRKLKHKNAFLKMEADYEEELAKTQMEVTEHTLNDIAFELHDDIGQVILFCIMSANRMVSAPQKLTTENVTELRNNLDNALQSIRGISKVLSNEYISSFGFHEALLRLFEHIGKSNALISKLDYPHPIIFKNKANELFLFRIIQELVNNTLKHAAASELTLSAKEDNEHIYIKYHDDGKGTDVPVTENDFIKGGMGLSTIRRRCQLIHGTTSIVSEPGKGFTFTLVIPNT